jgi:uncharacterized cupredoxin-like copper-binding protein
VNTAPWKPRHHLATVLVLGAAALSLAAAGCGDDDDGDTTAVTPTTTETGATGPTGAAGGGETVDISETEFALDPDSVDVKAGSVTFEVTNDGAIVHNFEVEGNGVEEALPEDLAAGDSGALTVDLEPGTYEMYCPIGNHADDGMTGEISVE